MTVVIHAFGNYYSWFMPSNRKSRIDKIIFFTRTSRAFIAIINYDELLALKYKHVVRNALPVNFKFYLSMIRGFHHFSHFLSVGLFSSKYVVGIHMWFHYETLKLVWLRDVCQTVIIRGITSLICIYLIFFLLIKRIALYLDWGIYEIIFLDI